jgi:hypothetical protein
MQKFIYGSSVLMTGWQLDQTYRPSRSKGSAVWAIILIAIIDVPLLLFLLFPQGPTVLFLIFGVIIASADGLILSLTFLGKRMSYILGEKHLTINLSLSKRRIPYASIRTVEHSNTSLLLRLFGASWPGFHWGLYKAKDVGNIWVYATKMKGDFILIQLVNEKKIAISPANPKDFLTDIQTWKNKFGTANPSEVEVFGTSRRTVYTQILAVTAAFAIFLGYLLWIYPSLPEIIPVHFDFNWNPNRWGYKSELFVIAGIAALFPIINAIVTLKFGKYGKELVIFLGAIFIFLMVLFFGIVYFTQTVA